MEPPPSLHRALRALTGLTLGVIALTLPDWVFPIGSERLEAQAPRGAEAAEVRTLTLAEALSLTLEHSRPIAQARMGLAEAEGQVAEAWGSVWPKLDLSGSYTRNLEPPSTFLPAIIFNPDAGPDDLIRVQFGADNVWSNTISLDQPLFQAQAFIGVGAAGRFRALQEEAVRGTTHQVLTRVRVLYYDLLLVQEQARLIERSVERVVQSLEETRALNRAGLVSDYDVLRLEVELANLEPQLRRAMNQAAQREREMVIELDFPEGTRLQVAGTLARMDLSDIDANDAENREILRLTGVELSYSDDPEAMDLLYRRARAGNSPIQQTELVEGLRHTEMRLEQAEYLPKVSLFGTYQVQAQQDGSPNFFGDSDQRGYGKLLGVQVTLPLFTGFQRGARVDQRRAALRSAEIDRELAEDRLRSDLRTLLEQVEEARLRATGQRGAVELARRGYEIASAQYREGLGGQLELTDAEVALRQSEFNYAEAVFDYLSSRARLDELVGDLPIPARGAGR